MKGGLLILAPASGSSWDLSPMPFNRSEVSHRSTLQSSSDSPILYPWLTCFPALLPSHLNSLSLLTLSVKAALNGLSLWGLGWLLSSSERKRKRVRSESELETLSHRWKKRGHLFKSSNHRDRGSGNSILSLQVFPIVHLCQWNSKARPIQFAFRVAIGNTGCAYANR